MPDGVVISGIAGDVGTAVIYHGMHGDAVYFKKGISLEGVAAPVVVDAGGNIGLFSRYICFEVSECSRLRCGADRRLAKLARENNKPYADRIKTLNAGLGKTPGTLSFTCKPTVTSGTSMRDAESRPSPARTPSTGSGPLPSMRFVSVCSLRL
jgi:hypothetical protein